MNFLDEASATTPDCKICTNCVSCQDAADYKGPMKIKGATLSISTQGLLVYGGAYW